MLKRIGAVFLAATLVVVGVAPSGASDLLTFDDLVRGTAYYGGVAVEDGSTVDYKPGAKIQYIGFVDGQSHGITINDGITAFLSEADFSEGYPIIKPTELDDGAARLSVVIKNWEPDPKVSFTIYYEEKPAEISFTGTDNLILPGTKIVVETANDSTVSVNGVSLEVEGGETWNYEPTTAGEYVVTVVDKFGFTTEETFNLVTDTTGPELEDEITFEGREGATIADWIRGAEITWTVTDTGVGLGNEPKVIVTYLEEDTEVPLVAGRGTLALSAILTGPLEDVVPLEVTVKDAIGNETVKNYSFNVDTVIPALVSVETLWGTSQLVDGVPWYKGNGTLGITVEDLGSGLWNVATVTVNDVESLGALAVLDEAGTLDLTNNLTVGENVIKVVFEDQAGNQGVWESTFNYDNTNPEIDSLEVVGDKHVISGVTHFQDKLTVNVTATDTGSGVDSSVLFRGEVALEGLEITTAGVYKVVVTDKLGNSISRDLGTFSKAAEGTATLVIDGEPDYTTPDGAEWFKTAPKVSADLSSGTFNISARLFDNETKLKEVLFPETFSGFSWSEEITSTDGPHIIRLEATDFSLNTRDLASSVIHLDSTQPTLSGEYAFTDHNVSNGKLYLPGARSVSVTGLDENGSGVATIEHFVDNVQQGTVGNLNKSGEHTFKVTDNVGNSRTYTLNQLTGLPSVVVLDTKAPEVTIERPAGSAENGWYGTAPVVDFLVTDDNLKNYVVYVNDVERTGLSGWRIPLSGLDGTIEVKVVAEDLAGNVTTKSLSLKVDVTKPEIGEINIRPANGEGALRVGNGSGRWGHFYTSDAIVEAFVSDPGESSGIKQVNYRFGVSGEVGTLALKDGNSVQYLLKQGFKDNIQFQIVDNVGHYSNWYGPDGVVVEATAPRLAFTAPTAAGTSSDGLPIYTNGVHVSLVATDTGSGLASIGFNGTLQNIGLNGAGLTSPFTAVTRDKNLVTSVKGELRLGTEGNGQALTYSVTDRGGVSSQGLFRYTIDTSAPQVSVTYNQNLDSNQYSTARTARIRVTEANFTSNGVQVFGNAPALGSWTQVSAGVWENSLTFAGDGDFQWGIQVTDRAGLVSTRYNSEEFTVDTVAPVIRVDFSGSGLVNGKYVPGARTATVTVVERNFDPTLIVKTGSGPALSGWSSNGETHTARIVFSEDGVYSFSIAGSDKSGNSGTGVTVPEFIVDTTAPEVKIEGITSGVSYRDGVGFTINVEDVNFVNSDTLITVKTPQGREIPVTEISKGLWRLEGLEETLENDGYYTLNVQSVDLAGNETVEELTFVVNRFGSQYKVTPLLEEQYLTVGTAGIVVEETSVERLDTESLRAEVTLDGVKLILTGVDIKESGSEGAWVYTYTIPQSNFTEDGVYLVRVFSEALVDGEKNSSLRLEHMFVQDTQGPEIIVSGVESGGFYTGETLDFTLEIRDRFEVVEASLTGTDLDGLSSWDGVQTTTLNEGFYETLTITAVDAAGNESSKEITNVRVTSSSFAAFTNFLGNNIIPVTAGAVFLTLGAVLVVLARKRKK